MSPNYITPDLIFYKSFDEFINPDKNKIPVNWSLTRKSNADTPFEWNDLLHTKRAFIIGEPGCGKSTSLKEIVIQASRNGKQSIIFPINQIPNKTSIEEHLTEVKSLGDLDEKNLFEEPAFKSNNFDWKDSDNIIVCLDALDEVNANDFNEVIQKLNKFSKAYTNISILISCRKHYITGSQNKFRLFNDHAYVEVQNFTDYQIRKFLEGKYLGDNKDEVINTIIQKSRNNADYSVLAIPRYLEVLAGVLQDSDKTPEDILKMKRVDFFEQFIYKKLEKEAEKRNLPNEVVITKRVLEKLALVMEIYQRTQITKEELVTFLDDTNSNANLLFLNQIDLDTFINRVLKHFGDSIQFDNTEFQEYLAAKELLRMGQRSQILFDLIIEPNLKHIYKNWYDVLRYVIELDASLVIPIVGLLKQKREYLVADDFFTLIATVDDSQLSKENQGQIFETIFNYFQKTHSLLDLLEAARIAAFYQDSNYKQFNVEFEVKSSEVEVYLLNQIFGIEFLIKQNKLNVNQIADWKAKLVAEAQNTNFPTLQYYSLHALRQLNDISIYEDLIGVYTTGNKEVKDAFLDSCVEVNPNCQFSIDLFIGDIKNRHDDGSRLWFNYVKEVSSIAYVLDNLIEDQDLLHLCFDNNHSISLFDVADLIDNIEEVSTEELISKSKDLLKAIFNHPDIDSTSIEKFMERLVLFLASRQDDYVFELLSCIPNDYYFYNLDKLLCKILRLDQVDKVVEDLKKIKLGFYITQQLFFQIKDSDNSDKDAIYEKGREYNSEAYEKWKNINSDEEYQKLKENRIYEQFSMNLDPRPGYFRWNAFLEFNNNKEIISARLTGEQREKLRTLLLGFFENNDIAKSFKVEIEGKIGQGATYNINNRFIYQYSLYLEISLALGLQDELQKYRRYFVQYLPIAGEKVEYVLEYLGELTEQDIQDLLAICTIRTDDFLHSSARSFIKTISRIQRPEFIPFLKEYIASPKLSNYEKVEALECLGQYFPDIDYLKALFSNFIEEGELKLAETANQYLITQYKDEEAIIWRFNQIKVRKRVFVREYRNGILPYSDFEAELDRPKLLLSIINLRDPSLIPKFKELLVLSFELRKDKDFVEYSNYLQKNVFAYYLNLKELGAYSYLKDLRYFIDELRIAESNSFKGHLRNLELEYIELLARPNNFADCIKKYNELKGKRYQPILSSLELYHIIQDVIDEDIVTFIQKEGFYRPTEYFTGGRSRTAKAKTSGRKAYAYINEDAIQKTIKIQIENGLLKRGFRDADIHREVQLYDDKRLDLLISYGFVGPVMVELKLLHNPEILLPQKRAQYKTKIKQYLAGSYSEYGIYLIFKVKNNTAHNAAFSDLQKEYKDIEALDVKKIDCCSL